MFTTMNCDFLETEYYYNSQHSGQGENECLDTLCWLKYVSSSEEINHITKDESLNTPTQSMEPIVSATENALPNLMPEVSNTYSSNTHSSNTENVESAPPNLMPEVSNTYSSGSRFIVYDHGEKTIEQVEPVQEEMVELCEPPQEETPERYVLPPRANRGIPPKWYSPEKETRGSKYPDALMSLTSIISSPFITPKALIKPVIKLKWLNGPRGQRSEALWWSCLTWLSPFPRALINCGSAVGSVIDGQEWLPDGDYIAVGAPKSVSFPGLDPRLSTARTFPIEGNNFKKFCYVVPVFRGGKYMVRTTYFYGGVNGNPNPPVFDQIVDGTLWSAVNTTQDYLRQTPTYYEGVFLAAGKTMRVCLGANDHTDSDPFISALEILLVGDSLYNSTDFNNFALRLYARHSFGYSGPPIRYPDDQFDRYWEPFGVHSPAEPNLSNVSVSGFWNLPPQELFQTQLGTNRPEPLELLWPPSPLPNATYHIALYFADDRDTSSGRVFNISLNGIVYYPNLNVTPSGLAVFTNEWLLSGVTNITLNPAPGSSVGPLINAGEVFEVLPLGGKTHTRDVIALERLKGSFKSPPLDWNGDPCLPPQYPWTGVVCSGGSRIRVIALNLTRMGLSGTISPSIANLSALSGIWLGNNNLSGDIPDLSSLKRLETLHLEDNLLGGEISPSLGSIESLNELFLQNNNLTGKVPDSLVRKPGMNLSLNSSFHKTVHFGGRGDGSSSRNQLTALLFSSLLLLICSSISASSPPCFSNFRLILLSFSHCCCICQNGSNFPSKNSSSAVIMLSLFFLLDRNSNSAATFLTFSFSFSQLGLMDMKSFSSSSSSPSRKSAENEILGLEVVVLQGSMEK
nr:probable LRR receptor-like serine/threonine-protein kinase At1g67720 [Ipomoea batatas]